MLWGKQQFKYGWNVSLREEKVSLTKRGQDGQQQAELKNNSSNLCGNRGLTVRSIEEQANVDRETVGKILTEDLDMRKVCAKKGPKAAHRTTKAKRSHNFPRPSGKARWYFGACHHRWWNMGLPIRPWNEAAKCTMKDCQFPMTKKIPPVQIKTQTMLLTFLILEGLFIMNLYQLDKQSTQFTIWKYWKGCVKKLDGNDPNILPPTHGPCIMTMHLFTRHCLWGRFLLLNK